MGGTGLSPSVHFIIHISSVRRAARRRREGNMKLPRRTFLHLAAGAAALPTLPRIAWAQTYPTRPVRLICGYPAGNTSDLFARLMGQWLSARLGQSFIVENRTGAGSNIGAEAVVKAAPDGYTLLLASATNAINTTLYPNLNFNFIRDIAPVASVVDAPYVMVINPSVPAKTLAEFIAYAKANPGKLNMASTGVGSATHVFGALFMMMAGVDLVHVPYRGNPMPDLLSGQVQVFFGPVSHPIEYIRAGKLRALAMTSLTRSTALPDIPIIADVVPGYEASGWYGICAPKNTPAGIIDSLNKEINAALVDPAMTARLVDLGAVPRPWTSAEFGTFIAAETEKWGNVIRTANIKPE
jgi:tripartite-type tricarboxylate transporter receptor subunit TctC